MTTQDFQTFKIYMKVARELQTNNPIVSYYLKTYALNKAVEFLKIERAQGVDIKQKTEEIKDWLQDLEGLKALLRPELANKEQCKQNFKDFTFGLYEKSNEEYHKGNYSRGLAKNFLYTSVLFDAWDLIGGQPGAAKTEKNYANEARFKIMDAIDKGQATNTNNTTNADTKQGAWDHIKPTPTGDSLTPGHKRKETLDPLSKLNFSLTESIVVPKSTIDKFLDGTRPDVKIVAKNVLDGLITEQPKGSHLPAEGSPSNVKVSKNPANPLGLPFGTSIRLDNEPETNRVQPEASNVNNNNMFAQTPSFGPVHHGFQQHVPGNYYPPVHQAHHPHSHFSMRPMYNNMQTGMPGNAQNFPHSVFGAGNMQNPQNQQNQQVILREIQNKDMKMNDKSAEMGKEGGKGNEIMMTCQEAKDFCLKAASELEFVNVKEAKEKIKKALNLLEQLENRQEYGAN